jgi:hypothetical protein
MEYLVQSHLHLARGSLLRIRDAREMVVYVWSGGIWVTQEGDGADRFIGPGGWVRISSAGVMLVSALGAQSTLTLTSPFATQFAERIDIVRTATGRVQALFASRGWVDALRARLVKTFAPLARLSLP